MYCEQESEDCASAKVRRSPEPNPASERLSPTLLSGDEGITWRFLEERQARNQRCVMIADKAQRRREGQDEIKLCRDESPRSGRIMIHTRPTLSLWLTLKKELFMQGWSDSNPVCGTYPSSFSNDLTWFEEHAEVIKSSSGWFVIDEREREREKERKREKERERERKREKERERERKRVFKYQVKSSQSMNYSLAISFQWRNESTQPH